MCRVIAIEFTVHSLQRLYDQLTALEDLWSWRRRCCASCVHLFSPGSSSDPGNTARECPSPFPNCRHCFRKPLFSRIESCVIGSLSPRKVPAHDMVGAQNMRAVTRAEGSGYEKLLPPCRIASVLFCTCLLSCQLDCHIHCNFPCTSVYNTADLPMSWRQKTHLNFVTAISCFRGTDVLKHGLGCALSKASFTPNTSVIVANAGYYKCSVPRAIIALPKIPNKPCAFYIFSISGAALSELLWRRDWIVDVG